MNAETKVKAAKKEPETLRIWNAVCKTDPRHTKAVEFGRKFTAIDAHYQIQEATRLFGPVGEGWGYDTGEMVFADGLVIVPVTLWHGDRTKSFGPIYGSTTLRDRKGNIDKDAPKKATTDALTKALSQLGFNADVFLGRFDDNKYVEERTKEIETGERDQRPQVAPKEQPGDVSPTALGASLKLLVHNLHGCGDLGELEGLLATEDVLDVIEQCQRRAPHWFETGEGMPAEFKPLKTLIEDRRKELASSEDQFNNVRTPIDAG